MVQQLSEGLDELGRAHSLAASTRAALMQSAQRVETPERHALFRRGETSLGLFVVGRGEYRVSLFSPEGRELIVRIARPGRVVVDGMVPEGRGAPVSVFARNVASAWALPRAVLDECSRADEGLARALFDAMAHRHARTVERVYDLSLRTVDQRLAAFLLEQRERGEETERGLALERELDVTTVAGLLGTVREEISRSQRRLAERGLIELSRQRVTILDLDGLRAFA